MIRNGAIYFIALLFFLPLFPATGSPLVRDGILDLRQEESPVTYIKLRGEWEFYWHQFIDPGNGEMPPVSPTLYAEVPSYWVQYDEEIPGVTGTGYGTYRLVVLFPEGSRDTLALHVPVFDASFELFLNGKPAGANGRVGTSAEESRPGYAPYLKDIILTKDTLEILIHVSNFEHRRGGFWKTMSLGDYQYMHTRFERNKLINYTLIGLLIGAFSLFLLFFIMDRRKSGFLFFALTAFGILLRLMNTGEYPGNYFMDLPWAWLVRLEYIGTYTAFIFGILFLVSVFPGSVKKWIIRINTIVFTVAIAVTVISPVPVFSYLILLLQAALILFLLYFTVYSFLGMLKRRYHETLFFFSIAVFLAATINDSLLSHSISGASNEYLIPVAFFVVISSNTMILLNQWVTDYREKERLNREVNDINRNLEQIIENRTRELNLKNQELERSLSLKNKLFSIIAHDLKSPVSTLAQYTEMMIDNEELRNQRDIGASVKEMTHSLIDLIDNLIYWGMSQRKKIEFHPRDTDLEKLVEKGISLFKQKLALKKIKVETTLPEAFHGWCDPDLISIAVRNLLSNAIKFTPTGGRIRISGKRENGRVTLSVGDNGQGMSPEKVSELMENSHILSTNGTENEKGTGLGFLVVRDLVTLNGGTLTLKSEPGRGTEVLFSLPGNHEK